MSETIKLRDPRVLMLLASVSFAAMAACVKAVSPHIPLSELVFFRSTVSSLLIGALLLNRGHQLRANNYYMLSLRSIGGLMAMSCNFFALRHLNLGDATTLINTSPLWASLLAVAILKERMSVTLMILIIVGWLGIVLLIAPQFEVLNIPGTVALAGAFFIGINAILIQSSQQHDPALRVAFYFSFICALASLPALPFSFVMPDIKTLILLVSIGSLGALGQIFMTSSYGRGDISRLAPLGTISVVVAYILGILFWGEVPNGHTLLGAVVIVGACVAITRVRGAPPAINRT